MTENIKLDFNEFSSAVFYVCELYPRSNLLMVQFYETLTSKNIRVLFVSYTHKRKLFAEVDCGASNPRDVCVYDSQYEVWTEHNTDVLKLRMQHFIISVDTT